MSKVRQTKSNMGRVTRVFDVIFSGIGLLVLWPVLLVIYVLGLFDTGSPLFKQERVGRDEKVFTLVKFRTMKTGSSSVATHLADPTQVTRLGRILRGSKLDELPQLLNVMRGEMSLVGPRPCLPSQSVLIRERRKRNVFDIRPGITGVGQVAGVDMSEPERLAALDQEMVMEQSLSGYFRLIFRTIGGGGRGDRIVQ